jgi:hypothetical protein
MRRAIRDIPPTLFVVAAGVVYALWATGTAMGGLSTRTIAAIVFALGFAACTVGQKRMAEVFEAGPHRLWAAMYIAATGAVGTLALVAGIIALVTASTAMLVTLLIAMAALWLTATARHALAGLVARPGVARF